MRKRKKRKSSPASQGRKRRQRALLLALVEELLGTAWELNRMVEYEIIREAGTLAERTPQAGLAAALAERARALEWLDQAEEYISAGKFSAKDLALEIINRTTAFTRSALTVEALRFLQTVLNDTTARSVIAACDPTGGLTQMVGPVPASPERPTNLGNREELMSAILRAIEVDLVKGSDE